MITGLSNSKKIKGLITGTSGPIAIIAPTTGLTGTTGRSRITGKLNTGHDNRVEETGEMQTGQGLIFSQNARLSRSRHRRGKNKSFEMNAPLSGAFLFYLAINPYYIHHEKIILLSSYHNMFNCLQKRAFRIADRPLGFYKT